MYGVVRITYIDHEDILNLFSRDILLDVMEFGELFYSYVENLHYFVDL